MEINWSLLRPVDVGAQFQAGLEHGQEQRRTAQTESALAAYASNPNDPGAVNALMHVAPRLGIQVQQQQQTAARQAASDAREAKTDQTKTFARLAKGARDAQTWDATIDHVVGMGYPEAAQFKGKFSPELRSAFMAAGGEEDEPAGRKTITIDGIVLDAATMEPLYETPYEKVSSGPGGMYAQPRIGIQGLRGGVAPPAGRVLQGRFPDGWEVDDEDEGGAAPSAGPATFP